MSFGAFGLSLVTSDDLLADFRGPLEPPLESGLGAVRLGGVEGTHPAGVGQPEQSLEHALLSQGAGAHLEHGDLDVGLAELPLGKDWHLGGILRFRVAGRTQGCDRGRGQRTGLEERAAVGTAGLLVGHRSGLLAEGFSMRVGSP